MFSRCTERQLPTAHWERWDGWRRAAAAVGRDWRTAAWEWPTRCDRRILRSGPDSAPPSSGADSFRRPPPPAGSPQPTPVHRLLRVHTHTHTHTHVAPFFMWTSTSLLGHAKFRGTWLFRHNGTVALWLLKNISSSLEVGLHGISFKQQQQTNKLLLPPLLLGVLVAVW